MKNYIWLFNIIFGAGAFMFSACCDDEPSYCAEEATIIGEDYRECACCGGWFIEIDDDTLRAVDLPQEFKESLDFNEIPLQVYMEWSHNETPCLEDEIEVGCIRRKEK